MASTNSHSSSKYAYATFITCSSCLAGVVLLAHTLHKHGSKHPLLLYYTTTLSEDAIRTLEMESNPSNMILYPVDRLVPLSGQESKLIAGGFADTWTKLRVFSEPSFKYQKICYLDADMLILRPDVDDIFTLPQVQRLVPNELAATPICCCNRDNDPRAPDEWKKENCYYTQLADPSAASSPPVFHERSPPTHKTLNGGMFVFTPSRHLWNAMMKEFEICETLGDMIFPDQEFLALFFRDRWTPLPWKFNALKTMRYWHRNIWRDQEVTCLHYIVDKPWTKRLEWDENEKPIAGIKGKDGRTHSWWWKEYEGWEKARLVEKNFMALNLMRRFVCPEDGSGDEWGDQDMRDIGADVRPNEGNSNDKDAHDANLKNESVSGERNSASGTDGMDFRERLDSGNIAGGNISKSARSENATAVQAANRPESMDNDESHDGVGLEFADMLTKYWRTTEDPLGQ